MVINGAAFLLFSTAVIKWSTVLVNIDEDFFRGILDDGNDSACFFDAELINWELFSQYDKWNLHMY